MMKIRFSRLERIAGVFVIAAFAGMLVVALSAAVRQGWFEPKVYFTTTFKDADGVHPGTSVHISGLRAGAVESVELVRGSEVRVKYYVLGKFHGRIRQNSQAQLLRPFIIGDRVLELSVGDEESLSLAENSEIPGVESLDLLSVMSGKNLNSSVAKIGGVLESLQVLMNAFADKSRAEGLVRMVDRLDPLLRSMTEMSKEVTKISRQVSRDDGLSHLVKNLGTLTQEMNKILPELNESNPALAQDIATMTTNLALVSKALGPAAVSIEKDLPGASARLIEALDQTVVTLKAMQKSIFVRGNVKEVLQEEATKRTPAQSP